MERSNQTAVRGLVALGVIGLLMTIGPWGCASDSDGPATGPVIQLVTTEGEIFLELFPEKAPATVKNFVEYVEAGFYDGTIFHRVIPSFMIQGGGFDAEMNKKPTRPAIRNEARNGLKNSRGTVSMARTSVVDSATSQFFINVTDNVNLDHRDETQAGFGYTVFGQVVEGMDVVDRIVQLPTVTRGPHRNVPTPPVVIEKATVAR